MFEPYPVKSTGGGAKANGRGADGGEIPPAGGYCSTGSALI